MLLTSDQFGTIGQALRKQGGVTRQRQLQMDVTLATASGDLIEARIRHFARGGVALITTRPMQLGDRFGFKVSDAGGAHFLFCEVLGCQPAPPAFAVNASFLEQEVRSSPQRLEIMN